MHSHLNIVKLGQFVHWTRLSSIRVKLIVLVQYSGLLDNLFRYTLYGLAYYSFKWLFIKRYTVIIISSLYFVLLYYYLKSWTISKTRVSFGICWFWKFQNTSYLGVTSKKSAYLKTLSKLRVTTHPPTLFLANYFLTSFN